MLRQLDDLDVGKPEMLQKGMQITNKRKRSELTLISSPLEINVSVIVKTGYVPLRTALVRQFATLTQEECLIWLQNFLFIVTPDLRHLISKITNICDYQSLGQQRNFLPGGPSGTGKTTLLNWLTALNAAVIDTDRTITRIIKVDAPTRKSSSKVLLERMILDCGKSYTRERKLMRNCSKN